MTSAGGESGNHYAAALQSKSGEAQKAGGTLAKEANDGANSHKDEAETSGGFLDRVL